MKNGAATRISHLAYPRIDSLEYGMSAGLDASVAQHLRLFRFRLDVNDVLVLYTDGITEAVDTNERQFTTQGIIDAALRALGGSAEAIQEAVMGACQKHIGDARRCDDLSIVVVKKLEDRGWDGKLRGTVRVGDKIDFTANYFRHNFPSREQFGLISGWTIAAHEPTRFE